jgi:hypothetical protein
MRIKKKIGVTTLKSTILTYFISVIGSYCKALLNTSLELNIIRYTTT